MSVSLPHSVSQSETSQEFHERTAQAIQAAAAAHLAAVATNTVAVSNFAVPPRAPAAQPQPFVQPQPLPVLSPPVELPTLPDDEKKNNDGCCCVIL